MIDVRGDSRRYLGFAEKVLWVRVGVRSQVTPDF